MIAVMVDAREPGSSSWVSVRSCRRVRVSGLHGGEAILTFLHTENRRTQVKIRSDGVFPFPEVIQRVKADIKRVTRESRVNIDLET